MTSVDIPINDKSTSYPIPSSPDPATRTTRSSTSSTRSSLIAHAQQLSSQSTSWSIHTEEKEKEKLGIEQVALGEMDNFQVVHRRISSSSQQLPPSPTLTRVPTNDSTRVRIPAPPLEHDDERQVVEEADIADRHWHPLEAAQLPEKEDPGSSLSDRESFHIDLETEKKPRRRANIKPAHLNLEPSHQPWDIVDPPPDNSGPLESDYYFPLQSTTPRNARRRPLIPHSAYYYGPPPLDCAYGTTPVGQIGVHYPREIVRIERDYASGDLIQFSSIYPIEFDGRITPTQFMETINDINEILISAHNTCHSFIYNFLAVVSLHLSTFVITSHYDKEMRRLKQKIEETNTQSYNPVGLNILWPRNVAFLFLEIEYY